MSAPFFLGKIIDIIYTNPTVDYGDNLTRLCLGLGCVFLCGATANAIRVYLMQTSGRCRPLQVTLRKTQGHLQVGLGLDS